MYSSFKDPDVDLFFYTDDATELKFCFQCQGPRIIVCWVTFSLNLGSQTLAILIFSSGGRHLTLAQLNQDRHCVWKQCRSRSDGFWWSHLIRIYTVYHSVCEFIWTNNFELSDWWTVRNRCGKLNLFGRIRVKKGFLMLPLNWVTFHSNWRQFEWNVKLSFKAKLRKVSQCDVLFRHL